MVGSGYGITEAGPLVAVPALAEPERIRVGTCGRLLPGTEAQVVDGEVWIRGPQLFQGYRDDADATAASSTPTAGCTPATSAASTTRAS